MFYKFAKRSVADKLGEIFGRGLFFFLRGCHFYFSLIFFFFNELKIIKSRDSYSLKSLWKHITDVSGFVTRLPGVWINTIKFWVKDSLKVKKKKKLWDLNLMVSVVRSSKIIT